MMKTFYSLLSAICILAIAVVLVSPMAWVWQSILIMAILGLSWRESCVFPVQAIRVQGDKILVLENGRIYEACYHNSSVVTRYLCFLHLNSPENGKRWSIPVSRLEFSGDTFRQLKCGIQRFSMQNALEHP